MSSAVQSILELVGHTPVVRLSRVASPGGCLHLKLEHQNPSGSLKDRVAVPAVLAALAEGRLASGQTLVEATRGNSAVSLALACATHGVKLLAVMPDSASVERRQLLRSYGVKVEWVPAEEGFSAVRARAEALAAQLPGGVRLEPFELSRASAAYEASLGAELVETLSQDRPQRAAFVQGVGVGASLLGVSRALRRAFPSIRVVGVRPAQEAERPHRLQELSGAAANLPPGAVDEWRTVSDSAAWQMRARLGREEGLLVGISTGANVLAALQVGEALGPGAHVYTLACDTGERDFSLEEQF